MRSRELAHLEEEESARGPHLRCGAASGRWRKPGGGQDCFPRPHASLYPHTDYFAMECKEVCGFGERLSAALWSHPEHLVPLFLIPALRPWASLTEGSESRLGSPCPPPPSLPSEVSPSAQGSGTLIAVVETPLWPASQT